MTKLAIQHEAQSVPLARDARASVEKGTVRELTWTWQHDLHDSKWPPHRDSDLSKDSPLTLRSDGTGHFKALVDSDDTWTVSFSVHVPGLQNDLPIPNYAYSGKTTFEIPSFARDVEFVWADPNTQPVETYFAAIDGVTIHGHL